MFDATPAQALALRLLTAAADGVPVQMAVNEAELVSLLEVLVGFAGMMVSYAVLKTVPADEPTTTTFAEYIASAFEGYVTTTRPPQPKLMLIRGEA